MPIVGPSTFTFEASYSSKVSEPLTCGRHPLAHAPFSFESRKTVEAGIEGKKASNAARVASRARTRYPPEEIDVPGGRVLLREELYCRMTQPETSTAGAPVMK